MQAVGSQLSCDHTSFDGSLANDANWALYVDHGGWSPSRGWSSIDNEIDRVSQAALNCFGRI
jgi:hypothetical protein